jgi:hypothetical protein
MSLCHWLSVLQKTATRAKQAFHDEDREEHKL